MRITVDTGILVRMNVKATGPARRLLESVLNGPHELVLSEFLLNETARVLGYPRLQKLYKLTAQDIAEHVELFRARADLVSAVVYEPILLADPNGDLWFIPPWWAVPMCCAPGIEISTERASFRFAVSAVSRSWTTWPSSNGWKPRNR